MFVVSLLSIMFSDFVMCVLKIPLWKIQPQKLHLKAASVTIICNVHQWSNVNVSWYESNRAVAAQWLWDSSLSTWQNAQISLLLQDWKFVSWLGDSGCCVTDTPPVRKLMPVELRRRTRRDSCSDDLRLESSLDPLHSLCMCVWTWIISPNVCCIYLWTSDPVCDLTPTPPVACVCVEACNSLLLSLLKVQRCCILFSASLHSQLVIFTPCWPTSHTSTITHPCIFTCAHVKYMHIMMKHTGSAHTITQSVMLSH